MFVLMNFCGSRNTGRDLSWFALNALVNVKLSCDKYLQESEATQINATT